MMLMGTSGWVDPPKGVGGDGLELDIDGGVQTRPRLVIRMVSPTPAVSRFSRDRADGRHGDTQVTGAVRNGDRRYA